MKIYKVQAPDGSILKIEGPEGASQEQIIQAAQAAFSQKQAKSLAPQQTYDPTEGMSGTEKFLAGAGKAMTDIGRGVRQYLPSAIGGLSNEDIAEARRLDAPLMNTGAGMAGNVVGNVATALPVAFIPGANTAMGAGLAGTAYGVVQPGVNSGERLKNAAIGGVASAAAPLLVQGAKATKSLVEPFYQKGRESILGRALRAAGGDKADDAMQAFSTAKGATTGVQPTVGMAARGPNLSSYAAMERATQAVSPDVTNAVTARATANQDAMRQALQGATPDVGAAKTARESIAGSLYNQARTQGIDPTVAQQLAPQIQSLTQRLPDDVVNHAKTLAKLNGVAIDDAGSVQGLHWVKKALDDKINEATRTGSGDLARAYQGLQSEFLDTLDQLSPSYGQARQKYAAMSQPVSQGQVMEQIGQRATDMRGNITLGGLTRAATDKTAQSVTGMPNATLAKSLTPQQQATINALRDDLLSSDFAATAGRGAGSDTVQKLAYSNMLQQAGVPTFLQNFAPTQAIGNMGGRALGVAYGEANQRLASELAQAMLDPAQAAQLMQMAKGNPQMQKALATALRSSAAIGSSSPGLIQANQE